MTRPPLQKKVDSEAPPIITFTKHAEAGSYRELIKRFTPPVDKSWRPPIDEPRSKLTIACITEASLSDSLRIEAQTTELTPKNYRSHLDRNEPDLLLVESTWATTTGYWHLAQHPASPERPYLLEILSRFRKKSIPTVYWITKGHEYHDHFNTFAPYFDFVFCADPVEVAMLRSEGVPAEVLLPCVQPMLYNPFRYCDQADAFSIDVLFDGWADIDRLGDHLDVHEKIKPLGLSIIESRYDIPEKRLKHFPAYADAFLGCVTSNGKRDLLKYVLTYLTCEPSLADRVSTQWLTLEAAACRLPILHYGDVEKGDIRREFVSTHRSAKDLMAEIDRLKNDVLYREKKAHLGWRQVVRHHTLADRLNTICQTAGIDHEWQAFPPISIISPTYRPHMIERCIDTYKRQTYPNKELIVVFNGDASPPASLADIINECASVSVVTVPNEMFTGACMNVGIHYANHRVLFKMDDDDRYGDNYVMDMMLYNRAVNADVLCKPNTSFYAFEGEDGVYVKANKASAHTINYLTSNSVFRSYMVAGNSISMMSDRARALLFDDHSYGAADASFIYSCAAANLTLFTVDRLNMLINRRNDLSSHTWKEEKQAFKERLECISEKTEDIFL